VNTREEMVMVTRQNTPMPMATELKVEVVFGVAREAGGRDFVEGKALQFGGAVADEFLDEI
jgi:hypothetical protein